MNAPGSRSLSERLLVIANPRAAGGRAGRARDSIARAVAASFAQAEVLWTEGPGHAEALAAEASNRADLVVALGGDGTCHEVVNGLVTARADVAFGTLPFGTGGDLLRSLQMPRRLEAALEILASGPTRSCDLGRVRAADGRTRIFVNVAGAGANAEVAARANRSSKRWGGFLTFLGATIEVALRYRPTPCRWSWTGPGGEGSLETEVLAGFVANGHWCGGGVHVGPGGSLSDGLLELTIVEGRSVPSVLAALPHLYDGKIGRVRGVTHMRVTEVRLEGALPLEADGETGIGTGPARWDVLPGALRMRGGWPPPPGNPSGL
jgi:diacylglycerol kinase (ATP)